MVNLRKRPLLELAVAALAVVLIAAGGFGFVGGRSTPRSSAQGGTNVAIKNFKFEPATLTVPVGATVTWTNDDAQAHTVTGSEPVGSSNGIDPSKTYQRSFAAPGSYSYQCSFHPFMTGTVQVG